MSSNNNRNKAEYIFPRIGIVDLQTITNTDLVLNQIQTYHGKYYQIFNLTNAVIFSNEKAKNNQRRFKWRGVPFSITQTIKILTKMEQYLRNNKGNTVIFCVNNPDSYLFVKVIVKEFIKMCRQGIHNQQGTSLTQKSNNKLSYTSSKQINLNNSLKLIQQRLTLQQPLFSQSLFQVYKKRQVSSPPVKIICSLQISSPNFIPMYQIWQQSRYNDFQLVYTHQISNQLVNYYFNVDKPLQKDRKSIGKKYYDNKPQTKYLQKPVLVCGDVKIICYSFNYLEKVKQFTIGFNTKHLIYSEQLAENQGILTFTYKDLFDKSSIKNKNSSEQQDQNDNPPINNLRQNNKLYDQNIEVYVKLQNWCQNQSCIYSTSCEQCQQQGKKLNLRYNQTQTELNKLYRQRTPIQIEQYLSIS